MLTKPDPLKAAIIRARKGDPDSVAAITAALDAEDIAAAKAEAAETERLAQARAKVMKALPDRVAKLVDDWTELERQAVMKAAELLAAEQLDREYGIVPAKVAAWSQPPARLTEALVSAALRRLASDAILPYDTQNRSGAVYRSDVAQATSEAAKTAPVKGHKSESLRRAANAEANAEHKRARSAEHVNRGHVAREAASRQRKRDRGIPGW